MKQCSNQRETGIPPDYRRIDLCWAWETVAERAQ